MASKKITELVQAANAANTDLFIMETANGTRSIPYSKIKENEIAEAAQPHPFANNAAAHNGIFRGKNLTNLGIDEICRRISNGSFQDLYIGDYFDITISTSLTASENVRCILAHFDYYWNFGDSPFRTHHAVIVPKNCFAASAKMNDTNTTAGAYSGSNMKQTTLGIYENAIKTKLNNHMLTHKDLLTTQITPTTPSMAGCGYAGASTNWAWETVALELMSEIQVYGSKVWSSSGYDTGCANRQLALFQLDPTALICKLGGADDVSASNRVWWWLRDVASAVSFAIVSNNGFSNCTGASNSNGVRPIFCIG